MRPLGLDSHLSTIALRWKCQVVSCLHFKNPRHHVTSTIYDSTSQNGDFNAL